MKCYRVDARLTNLQTHTSFTALNRAVKSIASLILYRNRVFAIARFVPGTASQPDRLRPTP